MPDYVYTMLPLEKMKTTTFSITPVFFNVGINEKATIAHKMGYNGPQEKNNVDNFKMLAEYCRRYRKLNLDTAGSQRNKREYSITPHSVEIKYRNLLSLFWLKFRESNVLYLEVTKALIAR